MTEAWLEGRIALVTGAALRLGRAIAMALAERGANVIAHYHSSREQAEAACAELTALGVQAWPLQADLASPDQAADLVPRAAAIAGPVQVLVNSASVFGPSTLADVTLEQVSENLVVNAWAPLALMRALAAQEIDEGRIVNLLDARVKGLDRAHVAYILSKHALLQLTRLAAVELAPRITVNAVAPGLVLPPPGEDEDYLAALAGSLPLQRHGSAGDVADAVAYLLQAGFVTGQVIFVDGGRHVREE